MKHGLSRLLNLKARALVRHLARALEGNDRSTHQARVAARRLGEALPLAGAAAASAAREVRKARRALGAVRELDVALELLRESAGRRRWSSAAVGRVRRQLELECGARRAAAVAQIGALDIRKLGDRVIEVSRTTAADRTAPRAEIRRRADERRRALAEAVNAVGALYDVERLHEVRIAVKKLRYSLELARDLTGAKTGVEIRRRKKQQAILGRLHDLQVLQTHIRLSASALVAGRGRISRTLERMVNDLETECRALHADWLGNSR